MDILLITQDFPPERGGIQTYMFELARELLAQGHRVRVICPGSRHTPNPLPALTDMVRLPVPGSWLFLPLLFYLPRYLRRNPSVTSVFYAQWQPALGMSLFAGKLRKHKSYCLVCGRELFTSVFGPLATTLMRRVFRRVDAVFVISREVMRLLRVRADPPCPIHLAYPGVDPRRFRPLDAGFLRERYKLGRAPAIVSITRMTPRKNLRQLILALPAIRREIPDAILLLCGEGEEKKALRKLAENMGLGKCVLFPGKLVEAELVAHFNLADVFVLPSLTSKRDIEGFGIVFLEAGACETPVIGTLAGGIPDAVENGETGLLTAPGDLQELEKAILDLLLNRAKAEAMGRQARLRIQQMFTWSKTAERISAWMN
jgi:phosphatidyl-myo-inositol dimannoside synthase